MTKEYCFKIKLKDSGYIPSSVGISPSPALIDATEIPREDDERVIITHSKELFIKIKNEYEKNKLFLEIVNSESN